MSGRTTSEACAAQRRRLFALLAHGLLACVVLGVLTTAPARAGTLTVSAAASLANAFRELAPLFEAQNPGLRVVFNFASSDALLAQAARGAPVDVFASADEQTIDRAERQKLLVPGSRRTFARNALVVVVPSDARARPSALADLQQPAFRRIAIGSASVPAGRYARSALEAAKLWPALEPRAVFAQNVRQALDYVGRGEVEAGFVYATDAALMKDKVRIALTVPTQSPILYPAAAITGSAHADGARRFIAFLLSPQAQTILARQGFLKP
jgi:molybdate transport system substrate-binding protein